MAIGEITSTALDVQILRGILVYQGSGVQSLALTAAGRAGTVSRASKVRPGLHFGPRVYDKQACIVGVGV